MDQQTPENSTESSRVQETFQNFRSIQEVGKMNFPLKEGKENPFDLNFKIPQVYDQTPNLNLSQAFTPNIPNFCDLVVKAQNPTDENILTARKNFLYILDGTKEVRDLSAFWMHDGDELYSDNDDSDSDASSESDYYSSSEEDELVDDEDDDEIGVEEVSSSDTITENQKENIDEVEESIEPDDSGEFIERLNADGEVELLYNQH